MKKFSLILALIMLVSCLGGAFAEAPAGEGASEGGPASAADVIDAANATANSEAAAEEVAEEAKCCCADAVDEAADAVKEAAEKIHAETEEMYAEDE